MLLVHIYSEATFWGIYQQWTLYLILPVMWPEYGLPKQSAKRYYIPHWSKFPAKKQKKTNKNCSPCDIIKPKANNAILVVISAWHFNKAMMHSLLVQDHQNPKQTVSLENKANVLIAPFPFRTISPLIFQSLKRETGSALLTKTKDQKNKTRQKEEEG